MVESRGDQFEKHIVLSVAVHVVLFLAFTVKAYIFPSEPIELRSAIRIDVVGLPDKTEPKKVAPKPKKPKVKPQKPKTVKTKTKPKKLTNKPKVDLNKAKTKQQQALEKLQAMAAIEKMKQEMAQQKDAQPEPEPTVEFKGNVVTSGSDIGGLPGLDFDKYYSEMSAHVKQQWSLPGWLASANLRAEAAVTVDEKGFVTSKRIYTSSGNEVFDDLVLQTVEKASPLPPPPSRLKSVLALKGMILAFPD
ncbi:MAG: TonB C-terminal domain-containing protein [Bdellovibrionales bacterium]|nr:TonB C-terminal domain-containing protein [Bdellovibrionales bacterium]